MAYGLCAPSDQDSSDEVGELKITQDEILVMGLLSMGDQAKRGSQPCDLASKPPPFGARDLDCQGLQSTRFIPLPLPLPIPLRPLALTSIMPHQ